MTGASGPTDCCFDGWAAHDARRARTRETSARITAHLVAAITDGDPGGRTLLDIGCGSGDLALASLARGAAYAIGLDLGPGAIEVARSLAAERGLAERSRFEVADAATIELPRADIVTLNRVLCCYPRVDALLSNTLTATDSVYAYTAPRDRGPIGAVNRLITWSGNVWYRVRAQKFRGFRAYVHDLREVDEHIRAAGFRSIRRERRGLWDLAVYVREGSTESQVPKGDFI
ncbi:MAG: methyltransferase domain-containing protein [Planctomycetaceae bacterium]